MRVQLTKLRAAPDAEVQPGDWETYICGSYLNATSLPVDYVLTGFLLEPIQLGKSVRVLRISRNGIPALGVFESTNVVLITEDGFITRNSVYRLRVESEIHPPIVKVDSLWLRAL